MKTTRLIMLGALLLPGLGCQLKIDPSVFPSITPPTQPATAPPTTRPTTIPVPPPSMTPTPGMPPTSDPVACGRVEPAAAPVTGTASQGAYNGQRLPSGYDGLQAEADVTAAIRRVERNGADWACFRKFFPGATTVYMGLRGDDPLPASPSPRPTTMIGIWQPPPPPCLPVMAGSVSISGMVFDEQGVPFAGGVEVRVRNASHSFSQDAFVENGHYYVYGAPAGEKLEITAVHEESGEARRRFVVPQAYFQDCGNQGFSVVNFGGPQTAEDAVGHRYPVKGDAQAQIQGQMAIVSGMAHDLWGNPLDGATIEVQSLSAEYPFKAQVTTSQGAYVVNNLPIGVPVEFRCNYPGHTARARVGVYFPGGKKNVVNFGGDPSIEDPQGPQYGLAPLPPEDYRRPVAIKGKVKDIEGRTVKTGRIKIVSLAPEVPFTATVTLMNGEYVVNGVPAGIEIEFKIEASGFEPTWRYERVRKDGGEINFGEGGSQDPEGEYYGLVEEVEDEE